MSISASGQINDDRTVPVPARRPWLGLIGWLLLCFGASSIGALFPPDDWYAGLNRPTIAPPNRVFGPVWTALYTMMAVAAWLLWRRRGFGGARVALALFVGQLLANATWSPLFFGLHEPLWALVDLAVLWCLLLATVIAFARKSLPVAALLVPYLAWVTFAGVLNWEFWRLNG
jgi:tryptophan-rich sensory protein